MKTKSERQNVPRAGNKLTNKSSSQEWKSDELMETRMERLTNEQSPCLFAQHTDRFIVDDDDMDSDTVAESVMLLKIQTILAQGEWSSVKDFGPIFKNYAKDRNKHSSTHGMCLQHWIHLFSRERNAQKIYAPSKKGNNLSIKQMIDITENMISNNLMRSMEWTELTGNTLHWFSQIQYSAQSQTLYGKIDWSRSKVHQNTELWALVVSQWNSSGIFPRIHRSPRVNVNMEHTNRKLTSRCSTTSHGDLKTMNRNVNQRPTSFRFVREDFHQKDGHSLDLDQQRSGILTQTVLHDERHWRILTIQ